MQMDFSIKKWFFAGIFLLSITGAQAKQKKYDVVVYGGTSAGVAAAIEASRDGKSVVLIEP